MNSTCGFGGRGFVDNVKAFFMQRSVFSRLLLVNIVLFLVMAVVNVGYWLMNSHNLNFILQYGALPSHLSLLIRRPWTLFTYMFLHEDFWHLFFNMMVLVFSARVFLQYLTQRNLLVVYVLGGVFGGLLYLLAYNVFPVFEEVKSIAILYGASASVLSVLVAVATYRPNHSVRMFLMGEMSFKWLAVAMVLVDILSISKDNPGGHIAHIGGALLGFLYGMWLNHGHVVSRRVRGIFTRDDKRREKQSSRTERPMSDEQYNARRAEEQRDIDAILDKIAKNGYASLTKEEKEFLFRNSNKP